MSDVSEQVKGHILGLSDEALTKLVDTDYRSYTEEAVAFAKDELARRTRAGAAKNSEGKSPQNVPERQAEYVPIITESEGKTKRSRVMGAIFLVLAALITYAAVLLTATIIIATHQGMRANPDVVLTFIFYAVLIAVCLWAGIRRRPKWEKFLGLTYLIMGALAFIAHFSLARVSQQGAIAGKAMLVTAFILAGVGAVCFLMALAKPRLFD